MSENKQQDKPSEQISSRQSERARTVVVPRVQSMQDYILKHHRKLDMIARSISEERDWPRFRVRTRLIQMGYVEAKGALNYVDGAYIEPFAFSRDKGMGQYSFVIDRENVIALYQADAPFRSLLRSGEYVYVDGHLCKNDPRYVRQDVHGLKLTPWANAHVDECCMRFVEVYEQCSLADYSFGELHSDEEYNRQYLTFAAGTGKLGKKEQLTEMRRILEMIPSSFPEALTFLMRRARVTIEQLEEKHPFLAEPYPGCEQRSAASIPWIRCLRSVLPCIFLHGYPGSCCTVQEFCCAERSSILLINASWTACSWMRFLTCSGVWQKQGWRN